MQKQNKLHFTEQQSRQQIVKSMFNSSKSKALWTFPKQKRFQNSQLTIKTSTFYNISSDEPLKLKNHAYGFGKSQRKLFNITDADLKYIENFNTSNPQINNPITGKNKIIRGLSFGQSRSSCKVNSYINFQQLKTPGPNKYNVKSLGKSVQFSMRPKTGHQKTYFIQNKQAILIPGPGHYNNQNTSTILGSNFSSKFRQNSLGGVSIMSKTKRFKTQSDKNFMISTNLYDNLKAPWSKGCPIPSQKRTCFVDLILKQKQIPGPGKYQLPSEFGHYKKIKSIFSKNS